MEVKTSPKKVSKKLKRDSLGVVQHQLQNQDSSKNRKVKKAVKMGVTQKPAPQKPQQSLGGNICMEGMSAAELTMIRRLAGNDPSVRKKTFRKLKKWLSVLSQKIPDTADCRSMIEPNFIRVWKALFYCMWMADKPLPQEQLAEAISDLQLIFASKPPSFLLFVEWFIRTMAREWNWIDRFRMDKFMMLFRRFLRKSLIVLAEKKWHNDVLLGYLSILSTFVFNHHPVPKNKKSVPPVIAPSPLGLQIHFIDIFMEELAKVGGENLKFQKTLKILSVFMYELGTNGDDRILDEIRERIFNHLMRQSDVGIDYQEQLALNGEEIVDEEEEEADDENEENDGEGEGLNPNEDDVYTAEMGTVENGVLDPRAGAVDVVLPQLDIDYELLYKKLIHCGGQKDVRMKNRKVLYSLASQFKDLTDGKYPLALPEDNYNSPAIPRKEVNKAAKRLIAEENTEEGGKKRKTKKQRKREAKRKLEMSAMSIESGGSEDQSQYINDEDLLDHVTDNYMSYIENEMESKENQGDAEDSTDTAGVEASAIASSSTVSPKENKKEMKEKKKRKWKTVVEVEADELEAGTSNGVTTKRGLEDSEEETIVVKRPKLKKRNSIGSTEKESIPASPLIGKAKTRRLTELMTPTNQGIKPRTSLTGSGNKRVSFIMARNLEHEHADYPRSIARSPAIPFDKDRKPNYGLLKSPGSTTPKSTPLKRASAIDFF